MNDDPIVAEVRRIRDERARLFDYDIHKIFSDIIARGVSTDPVHPLVKNVNQWIETGAAEETLAVREAPPTE